MIFRTMRLRKKFLSFLTILGLCIPALTSLYSSSLYADKQNKTEQQLAEEQHEREYKAREAAEIAQLKANFIGMLCQQQPSSFKMPIIMSGVEFSELDMSKLIGKADMPFTAFGSAGLRWLSLPVANHAEISRRQDIIRTLIGDESSFEQLHKALQTIKKGEDELIPYYWGNWNKEKTLHNFIEENILPNTKKPKKLSWIGEKQYALTQAVYGDKKNKFDMTVPGLELAAASPLLDLVGLSVKAYISYCLSLMLWQSMDDWKDPEVWKQVFMPSTDKAANIFKDTLEDLWYPLFPWERMQVPNSEPAEFTVWDYADRKWNPVNKKVSDMGPWHAYQVPLRGSAKDKFIFGSEFAQRMAPDLINRHPALKNIAGAGLVATTALQYYLYSWGYFKVCGIWKDGKELVNKMHELHASLVDIAKLMRSLKDLHKYTQDTPVFNGSYAKAVLEVLLGDDSEDFPELKELMELFATKTFDSADTFLYSRGRVLRAHLLLQKVKDAEITLLLQAVAELDGYCAIARLMKAYEDKENKYVFAEFVNSDTPRINISSCWEPLAPTKNPVVNDIRLGAEGKPIRMIITGPNGGGKSTFLKSVGHAVAMAQSWGIVPASKAELTMFNELRTSLDPKEDLSAGISKFTAQKERIGAIQELMKQSTPNNKMLVILDEPYTGTIDDQMADRVHQFGQKAAQAPHAALCIATHVKKPIELARNGSFANYQIEILEPKIGQFVRTFKVKDGAAQWWFNDKPRVTRFIDWLNPASMRQNSGVQGHATAAQDGKQAGAQPGRAAVAA